jgi:hypothetical protein
VGRHLTTLNQSRPPRDKYYLLLKCPVLLEQNIPTRINQDIKLVNIVHDELVFEVGEDKASDSTSMIEQVIVESFLMSFPEAKAMTKDLVEAALERIGQRRNNVHADSLKKGFLQGGDKRVGVDKHTLPSTPYYFICSAPIFYPDPP